MSGNHGGIFLSTQPWKHMNKGLDHSKSLNDSEKKDAMLGCIYIGNKTTYKYL
jgi:hypothetical protein